MPNNPADSLPGTDTSLVGDDNKKLFDAFDAVSAEQETSAAASAAAKVNPDKFSTALKASKEIGVPVEAAMRQPEAVQQQQVQQRMVDAVIASPSLREKIKDPTFAALASDDVKNLVGIDKKVKQYGEWKAAPLPKPSLWSVVKGLASDLSRGVDQTKLGAQLQIEDLFYNKGQNPEDIKDPEQRAVAMARRDSILRSYEQLIAQKVESTPEFDNHISQIAYDTAGSMLELAPALIASAGTGSSVPVLSQMYLNQQMQTYLKYRARGATVGEAELGSNLESSIAAAAWSVPMKYFTSKLGQVGTGRFLADLLGKQIPAGLISEWGDSAVDTAIANPNKTWADYWSERPQATLDTVLSMTMFSGALAVPNLVVGRNARMRAAAFDAMKDSDVLGELRTLTEQSKLAARDPEAFASFMQEASKDGISDVYVDKTDFERAAKTVSADQIPDSIKGQLNDAKETGALIRIPLADYLAHLSKTPLGEALFDHLRTSPDSMSRAEAQTHIKETADKFEQEANKVLASAKDSNDMRKEADTVKAYFDDQLKKTGRFTRDVNGLYSSLMRDFYVTMSARAGMKPTEMLNKFRLQIQREEMPGDAYLQAGQALTKTPEFAKAFAGSKAVDASGAPRLLYHGTRAAFGDFKGNSIFFTSNPTAANNVAEFAPFREGGNVRPAYLALKNPSVIDAGGKLLSELSGGMNAAIDNARRAGHDGVIVRNARDPIAAGTKPGAEIPSGDIYVAFHPKQVISALSEPHALRQEAVQNPPAQVSWEATPGSSTGILPQLSKAPVEQQREYLNAVSEVIAPKGKDLLADLAGLPKTDNLLGFSAWEGKIGVGGQSFVPVKDLSSVERNALDLYAALKGYVLSQDAVVWHQPHYNETDASKHNGAEIHTSAPLTEAEMRSLYSALNERFGTWELAPGYTHNGARILNFLPGLKNETFQKGVDDILKALSLDNADKVPYRSEGNYLSNDWSKDYNGEAYEQQIKHSGGEKVFTRARELRASIQAVNDTFAEKYGWDKKERPSLFDTAGKRALKEHGEAKPGTLSLIGVHFSSEAREQLNSGSYGSGMRGAESRRLQHADERLRHRIYFYVSEGKGVRPEQGVGGTPHVALLHNIYDASANPRGFDAKDSNTFEKAVLDAGYNGYYVRSFYTTGEDVPTGGVVLLGPRTVDVSPVEAKIPPLTTAHEERKLIVQRVNDIVGETKPEEVPGTLHQEEPPRDKPTYYSALSRAVDVAKLDKAPPSQWRAVISSMLTKGVKKDEIVMSGVLDWLDAINQRPEKVTKEEVQNFLSDNGVKIAEKILGEPPLAREMQAQGDTPPLDEPSESQIDARAEELWNDQLQREAEDSAQSSDYISYEGPYVVAPNIEIAELPPDMLRSETQYALRAIDYPDKALPLNRASDLEDIGDAAPGAYHEQSGQPVVFDSKEEAQKYIDDYGHQYDFVQGDAPYFTYRFYDDEPAGQYDSRSEAEHAATEEQGQRYNSEVESYIENASVHDHGDYFFNLAREELMNELNDGNVSSVNENGVPATRHTRWQSDGGRDYRELVLSDPKIEPWNEEDSTHFQTDTGGTTVAWSRFKIHDDKTGRPTLFIEELQSQRAQSGKEQGFREDVKSLPPPTENDIAFKREPGMYDALPDDKLPSGFVPIHDSHAAPEFQWYVIPEGQSHARPYFHNLSAPTEAEAVKVFVKRLKESRPGSDTLTDKRTGNTLTLSSAHSREGNIQEAIAYFTQQQENIRAKAVPGGPFVKDTQAWTSLILKRVIRYAVDRGITQIAWTPAVQQVERYGGWLRSNVDKIEWAKEDNGQIHIDAFQGSQRKVSQVFTPDNLRSAIGNAMADKILSSKMNADVLEGDNIRIDDTGMAHYYGNERGEAPNGKPAIVPIVAKKILKSIGGGELKAIDMHDLKEGAHTYPTVTGFEITPEMAAKVQGGLPLFQERQNASTPRGQIVFNRDITSSPTTMTLLQNADLSTFMHETGHFFLEVMNALASGEKANAGIVEDFNKTLQWMGVKDAETWNKMTLDEKRDYHEKFARGFEAWLFEGKAPTPEAQTMFSRFRSWLLNVYHSLTALNVNLSDEVRGVFSRMLASETAIKQAEEAVKTDPLFKDAKTAGMSEAEFEAYKNLPAEATSDAVQQLERRSLANMKWMSGARSKFLRDMQREVADKRKTVRAEVQDELANTPTYRVWRFLKSGEGVPLESSGAPHKLARVALEEMYPADAFPNGAPWTQLPRWMVADEGLHPSEVAKFFGFGSGDELVRMMIAAEPFKTAVESATDQRMIEKYGDISSAQEQQRAADAAVHNEARAKFVAMELNALAKLTNAKQPGMTYRVSSQLAKNVAERIVAAKRVSELRPAQYSASTSRLAKDAEKAFKKGNTAEAAMLKRQQLVSLYASKIAERALEYADKARSYLRKFDSSSTRKSIDPDYVDQIDAILERYDVRRASNKDVQRRQSLAEWIKKQEDLGLEPNLDPQVMDEALRKHYTSLTVEELRGLVDSIRNIEHLGRLKKKLITLQDEREFDTITHELASSIEANAKRNMPEMRSGQKGTLVSISRVFNSFKAEHRKFASVVREMDGFKDDGTFWNVLVRGMNKAGDKEAVMNDQATRDLAKLFAEVSSGTLLKQEFIPAIGKSLSLEERIGIALNMGNEINRERVMTGERWTPQQLQAVVDTLGKAHWDFVQHVWNYLESFRPEIAAKEKRVSGIEPEWVQASPVVTRHGVYRGGYYPIKYDPLRSTKSSADVESEVQRQIDRGLYTRAMTRRGHLKERVESTGRPMRYDLGVITQHVEQVVHDLSWHEWLIDANRVLRSSAVDGAIRAHYRPEVLTNMRDALRDIAMGYIPAQGGAERSIAYLRKGATIVGLGWRLTTALLQPFGLTQSYVRLGPKYIAKGLGKWLGDAARMENSTKWIYEKSPFMKLRGVTLQREISEIENRIKARPGGHVAHVRDAIEHTAFYAIQKMQMTADIPTWLGAYYKFMEKPDMTEERAIALADQTVIDTQGSGMIKDLSSIQKGSEFKKLWTNFYSFFNTTYNLAAESTGATKFNDVRSVGKLASDYLMLFVVPSVLYTAMRTALGKNGDDPEKILKAMIEDEIGYIMGTMVGLRDLSGAFTGFDFKGPAGTRAFADVVNLATQIKQGVLDMSLTKALLDTAGVLFHLPTGQVTTTMDGIKALSDGTTENPGAVIVGAPSKK